MARRPPFVAIAAAVLAAVAACAWPAAPAGRGPAAGPANGEPHPAAGADTRGLVLDPEEEEIADEDHDLIGELIAGLPHQGPGGEAAEPEPGARPGPPAAGIAVPAARESWDLSDEQCLALLAAAGIETAEPDFPTPLVRTPLLLTGPVEGVVIRPRWPRTRPINAVMDCRLVLALVAVARETARAGFSEVLFYSTYRPLEPPPAECPAGKKGAACRRAKRRYEKALAGPSQHRRALAIDIRFFVRPDGSVVDVLEHYERNDGKPPCDDEPETEEGRFLKDLACELHRQRVFNVVLTPNADKAHHNHFHFDITPDARWYIVR